MSPSMERVAILFKRAFGILVDGHDDLAGTHAGQMLNLAGNPGGHIKFGTHGTAREPDLMCGTGSIPRPPPHGWPHGAFQRLGQIFQAA
jgi:hypothetical protein